MTSAHPEDASLYALIGYEFQNHELLEEALTHKSFKNENRTRAARDNERLEFLGDSVLGLCLTDSLMRLFPEQAEGQLSKRRAALVNEDTIREIGLELGLQERLRLGRGEQQSGGATKSRLVASAFEALIGAIYLDGGLAPVMQLISRLYESRLRGPWSEIDFDRDYKTRFQEIVQKEKNLTPTYVVMSASGPEHDKTFEVEVRVADLMIALGRGKTKKQAEQEAARAAIEESRKLNDEPTRSV